MLFGGLAKISVEGHSSNAVTISIVVEETI